MLSRTLGSSCWGRTGYGRRGWVRVMRCGWRRGCACTGMNWMRRPLRWRLDWPGPWARPAGTPATPRSWARRRLWARSMTPRPATSTAWACSPRAPRRARAPRSCPPTARRLGWSHLGPCPLAWGAIFPSGTWGKGSRRRGPRCRWWSGTRPTLRRLPRCLLCRRSTTSREVEEGNWGGPGHGARRGVVPSQRATQVTCGAWGSERLMCQLGPGARRLRCEVVHRGPVGKHLPVMSLCRF
mmetsp:Transcript_47205/g.106965  ORF Transcript_47205/g.106965 Transcript_47205/m.106965 type:complete len:240 (+) Transcript_47205:783-1502(+)